MARTVLMERVARMMNFIVIDAAAVVVARKKAKCRVGSVHLLSFIYLGAKN